MKCPRCGLINPETALRCDCGYDFVTKQVREPHLALGQTGGTEQTGSLIGEPWIDNAPQDSSGTTLAVAAGVLYLLLGASLFILGALQWLIGFSTGIPSASGFLLRPGTPTLDSVPGMALGSVVNLVFGILLLRSHEWRTRNGALGLAVIGAPVLLLNYGVHWVIVAISTVWVIGGALVLVAWFRGEF